MTAYIANHQKKVNIFKKEEAELIHAIKNNFDIDKINKAAEKLIKAKLQIFKLKFYHLNKLEQLNYKPDKDEITWKNISIEEIIVIYKNKIYESK